MHKPVHRVVATDRGVVDGIRGHPRQPEGGHPLAYAGGPGDRGAADEARPARRTQVRGSRGTAVVVLVAYCQAARVGVDRALTLAALIVASGLVELLRV